MYLVQYSLSTYLNTVCLRACKCVCAYNVVGGCLVRGVCTVKRICYRAIVWHLRYQFLFLYSVCLSHCTDSTKAERVCGIILGQQDWKEMNKVYKQYLLKDMYNCYFIQNNKLSLFLSMYLSLHLPLIHSPPNEPIKISVFYLQTIYPNQHSAFLEYGSNTFHL